jgi:hypothetical protein
MKISKTLTVNISVKIMKVLAKLKIFQCASTHAHVRKRTHKLIADFTCKHFLLKEAV